MNKPERLRGLHRFSLGALSALIVLSLLAIFLKLPPILAQNTGTMPNCPVGLVFNVSPSTAVAGTTQLSTISGVASLMVGSTTASSTPINRVLFTGNGIVLGRAQATSSYSWSMPWVSSLMPNGSVNLQAVVTFSNNTECRTNNISININNPKVSKLTAVVTPASWQGPMSFSFPITTNVGVPDYNLDVTQFATYDWKASIGNVSPIAQQAQFSSGQTVGTGAVLVIAHYGGADFQANIPVVVANPNTPLPSPTTSNNSTSTTTSTATTPATSTSSNTTTTTTPVVVPQRVAALQNNPSAQDCAVGAVGKDRFEAINTGATRPTAEELKKLSACFASSNFILPSNFAPVAPAKINELPTAKNVEINKLENRTKTNDAGKKDVLTIKGKAAPNSIVIVYIFSDPLVLTTTADANGDWSYALEDPIESGKHEVYAVVDKGSGTYEKSNPFSFVIGKAEAAASNPTALSLKLADTTTPAQSNRSMYLFIVGAILLVLILIVGFAIVYAKKRKKPSVVTPSSQSAGYNGPTNTIISPKP